MLIQDLIQELGVLPLRAIAFQVILLLVAIALEAIVLRQRLQLGYQPSVQYAATLNLLATSLGWLVFLSVEPFAPDLLQTQIMSYVLFNHFYSNQWSDNLPLLLAMVGITAFFATLGIKLKGLEWLMKILGTAPPEEPAAPKKTPRMEKYQMARQGKQSREPTPVKKRTIAVLEANALSFTAILVLIILRNFLEAKG